MARAGKRERARIRREELAKRMRVVVFNRACGGWTGPNDCRVLVTTAPAGKAISASDMLNDRRCVGRSSRINQPWDYRKAASIRAKNLNGREISLLPIVRKNTLPIVT
jgi:hypothetical protein